MDLVVRGRPAYETLAEGRSELKVLLPQIITEQLRQWAAPRGVSGSTLAAELLVTVARDGLEDAVLEGSSQPYEAPPPSRVELKVLLPSITVEQLRQRAALRGIAGSVLAAELLITIASDGLYNAVLEGG
jgi:hypothetical protein